MPTTETKQQTSASTALVPTIGRVVHYCLHEDDAAQINRRRTTGASIAERMKQDVTTPAPPPAFVWPAGAQAHIGNVVKAGDVFPMIITAVWGTTPESAVNGQVFLDGTDVLWVTSVTVGVGPRYWQWPSRV